MFNAYNATVWQPLPVHEPQHLAVLERHYRKGGLSSQFSIDDYRRIHDNTRTLSAVAAEGEYDTVLAQSDLALR